MFLFLAFLALCNKFGRCDVGSVSGAYNDPHCKEGTNGIVHLLEWKWSQIQVECSYLSAAGYCGVQTSVPTEHIVLEESTWWERLLPVSYKLKSRSGDETEFSRMVRICNDWGVRVFVSLELNHMSPDTGRGYGGTYFDGTILDYPGVPYDANNFHTGSDCSSARLANTSSPEDFRKCRLLEYPDLDQSNFHVRKTMVTLLNDLISIGVSGFFFIDAIHISHKDLGEILQQVNDVQSCGRPFVTFEIINTVESTVQNNWYFPFGRVTDFTMSEKLGKAIEKDGDLSGLCEMLQNPPAISSTHIPSGQSVVFLHDEIYQRGFAPQGVQVLTNKKPGPYKLALSYLLASGYSLPRIMSSYVFTDNGQGPPLDSDGKVQDVLSIKGDDEKCHLPWICEHRFNIALKAIDFSNEYMHHEIENCSAAKHTVYFTRGGVGHFWAALGNISTVTAHPSYTEMLKSKKMHFDRAHVWSSADEAYTVVFYTEPTDWFAQPEEAAVPDSRETVGAVTKATKPKLETTAETKKTEPTSEPKLKPKSTDEPKLKPESTDEPKLKPESTDEPKLKPESTDEPKLKPESTDEPKLKPESTDEPKLKPESTDEPKLKLESTDEPKLKPESTDEPELKPESTDEPELKPESTDEAKLKPESTDEPKLKPESTDEPKLKPESTDEPELKPDPKPKTDLAQKPTQKEPSQKLKTDPAQKPTQKKPAQKPKKGPAQKPKTDPAQKSKTDSAQKSKTDPAQKSKTDPAQKSKTDSAQKSKTDFRRTVIFIKKVTEFNQEVFIRGFAAEGTNKKRIPIVHNDLNMTSQTEQRDAWAKEDHYLSWNTLPMGRTIPSKVGKTVYGTPAQWTTKYPQKVYYHPLNTYGVHYWLVDVQMDCSKTVNGLFEFSGVTEKGYTEREFQVQARSCHGMHANIISRYHVAMCGKINIFKWEESRCTTKDFP